ncbi:ribonuclease H-like domain-containing protein [Tanacetum coccineum]|uniref:Ribonuclease H-like domain-containing protein n=1 Tax=Tanacetum coccineum TaxID=301880 RepID=A0ABQ5E9F7_9ASTR
MENTQNNALAKLPMLKLGEYEMWEIRIKQYFQIQDYALWEVIENGNSWVPIPVTTPPESGTSTTTKMTVPATIEEKTCKKNDVKARSLLLMALSNEHQLTFNQYVDAQSVFAALKLDLEAMKQQRRHRRLFWMNKPDFDTMGLDDLYNNFKIVEQKVKKSAEVSTATTKVNTASTEISTASFSDATVYAFLSTQPKGSQLVHEDLEQLHDDDLEEMDLKWNMALLSMRARKFYQRTRRKIIIDGSNTAGYDKSKVECFNCHKMGHFFKECMSHLGVKTNKIENQGSSTKTLKIEDASEKANVVPKDGLEEFKEPEVNEYGPRDSSLKPTTGCDKESDNSKENTDDSLEQHQMTDTETSSFESPLKSNSQLNDKGFVDSGCSRHMTRNIAHLSDFKDFDGGYVTFGGGAYGGRITGKGAIKTDNLDFDNVRAVKN